MRMPQFPVYVISKGRSDCCLTARFLRKGNVPFYLVIEPHEKDLYAAEFGEECLLVLPFQDLGQGSIPARNFVWEHAAASNVKWHWILDDNIRFFNQLVKGKRLIVSPGLGLSIVEDFAERYENIAIAGMNYSTFVGLGMKQPNFPPFYLNTHVYSCMMIRTDLSFRWRGRYNEDTDLCLQVLTAGWCTVAFNVICQEKMATMTMKGGNTDKLYQGDGRLRMARSLEEAWPYTVQVGRRYGRPQHVVHDAWRKFDTQLIRRADIDWDAITNNVYESDVVQVKPQIKSPRMQRLVTNKNEVSNELNEGICLAERLTQDPQIQINYPIYIPSKNRAEQITVTKLFDEFDIPYLIAIEPQDFDKYAKRYSAEKLLMLDRNDAGIDYSRNFMKQHATDLGYKFHWQFDDDIKSFKLRKDGKNIPTNPAHVINIIESVVNLYSNVGAAAAMYDTFAYTEKRTIKLNKMVASAMLLRNDDRCHFRPVIIEDIDITMQYLTCNYVTLVFTTALVTVPTTINDKGGLGENARIGEIALQRCENLVKQWGENNFKIIKKKNWNDAPRIAPSRVWSTFTQQPIFEKD